MTVLATETLTAEQTAREQVDAFNAFKESRQCFDSMTLLKQIGAQPK
jgi:hypothetical protein